MGQAKNRQAEIAALKATGTKPARPAKALDRNVTFFYSPTDTEDDVVTINFGNLPMTTCLPLEMLDSLVMNEAELAKLDEIAKHEDIVADMFAQLRACSAKVSKQRKANPSYMLKTEEVAHLVLMAQNINWLTTRGHLKQSEYNGTLDSNQMLQTMKLFGHTVNVIRM